MDNYGGRRQSRREAADDGHGVRLKMTVMEAAAHSWSRAKAARRLRPAQVFIIYSAFRFY